MVPEGVVAASKELCCDAQPLCDSVLGMLGVWLAEDLPPPSRVSIDGAENGGAKNHPSPPSRISTEVEGWCWCWQWEMVTEVWGLGEIVALRFKFSVARGFLRVWWWCAKIATPLRDISDGGVMVVLVGREHSPSDSSFDGRRGVVWRAGRSTEANRGCD